MHHLFLKIAFFKRDIKLFLIGGENEFSISFKITYSILIYCIIQVILKGGEIVHKFYKSFNFSYLYLFQNTFKIIFTHVIYYVFLKLKEVNPIFKCFWFLDSYFEKQRGRNYFCLHHFQIYVFHLHTLTKGNQLFLKVFCLAKWNLIFSMNSHSSNYAFWLCQKGGESWIDCKNCSYSTKEISKYFWTIFEQFCENFKWFYKLDFNLKFSHRNIELKRVKYFHAINCFCHHQKGGECWFVIPSPICFDDFYNWLENIVHFYSMWKLLLRFQKLLFTILPLINILDKSNF